MGKKVTLEMLQEAGDACFKAVVAMLKAREEHEELLQQFRTLLKRASAITVKRYYSQWEGEV